MPFSALIEPLRRAVASEGYERPTPIQEQAIPHVLAGRDLLGCAQTGTGKTAAFALPILQRLAAERTESRIRALVLSPTRELAAQIGASFGAYDKHLGLRHTVVFGGVSQVNQERALRMRPAILIATPGRLLDLCQQKLVDLSKVEVLVLDEADRMLDMGFIHDVRRIAVMIPRTRQTLLFSATLPQEIVSLAKSILVDPVRVDIAPATKTADTVRQAVYFVAKADKRALLEHVLEDSTMHRVVVFTRTKHGASRVARHLDKARISADAIHGDKTQGARERALSGFKNGDIRVLVATDIAARGIDVDAVSHVVNYDLPMGAESYVHRIGRTGRAGASGIALSFCDVDERPLLDDIEKLIAARIPVMSDHPYALSAAALAAAPAPSPQKRGGGGGQRQGGAGQHRAKGRSQAQGGGSRDGGSARREHANGGGQRREQQHGSGSRDGGGPRRDPPNGGGSRNPGAARREPQGGANSRDGGAARRESPVGGSAPRGAHLTPANGGGGSWRMDAAPPMRSDTRPGSGGKSGGNPGGARSGSSGDSNRRRFPRPTGS
ncbi:MAG TPA: DEAD/DEAH box helicase [Polyangiaceae bacterium]